LISQTQSVTTSIFALVERPQYLMLHFVIIYCLLSRLTFHNAHVEAVCWSFKSSHVLRIISIRLLSYSNHLTMPLYLICQLSASIGTK
jgi:hypothetical protein